MGGVFIDILATNGQANRDVAPGCCVRVAVITAEVYAGRHIRGLGR